MTEIPALTSGELILRLVIAAALGGSIGFEREFSDQPAGFRTHILVSLGSALFTLVGIYGPDLLGASGPTVTVDPTRVAAQVVTGIGFLGAGAIIQQGVSVKGLTTAASLWVTAAVGTTAAFGYHEAALVTTIIALASLYVLKKIEQSLFPRLRRAPDEDSQG